MLRASPGSYIVLVCSVKNREEGVITGFLVKRKVEGDGPCPFSEAATLFLPL
jgi:hypothetical protein